ncbi:MAG TPA: hypothetical protein PKB14_04320 [Rubrivivax sp.]|nr:hypothetical protein [Rubrivivax sp.]
MAFIASGALLTACSDDDDESGAGSAPLSTGLAAISSGYEHSCALTSAGGVKCWGYNRHGALGTGTTSDSANPTDVVGLGTGAIAISAGMAHTCALTSAGGVKCWGFNWDGRLGSGSRNDSVVPADVSGLNSGATAISAGAYHSCAITGTGGVKCWGQNSEGQLGNGSTTDSVVPTDVVGLGSGVAAISAGSLHTCAVTNAGGVKCWGRNGGGTLGIGTTDNSSTPRDVIGLSSGISAVSAGLVNTCALTRAGSVKCWGQFLDQSGWASSLTPVGISGLSSGVSAISSGEFHICALTSAGGIKCWGQNLFGELGNGTTSDTAIPTNVAGLSHGMGAISAGGIHTCALTREGTAKCWGYGVHGALGNGVDINYAVPAGVAGLTHSVSAVSAGGRHACAITSMTGLECWGGNRDGQLGNGTTADSFAPAGVSGLSSGVKAVSAGGSHTCATTNSGAAVCWGNNFYGQLGDAAKANSSTPASVAGLSSGVDAAVAGWSHSCAMTSAGGVECWGSNADGQLGDGSTTDSSSPVMVIGLGGSAAAISTGRGYTCTLTHAGGVKCWGWNGYGQLGNGSRTRSAMPADVIGLRSGVIAIAGGAYHSCALTGAGGVKCWGSNSSGELGNGGAADSATPTDVVGLGSGVAAIGAGLGHTCAVTTGGGVKCWGRNTTGQLGNGTSSGYFVPTEVIGLSGGVSAISAGDGHTCALTRAGGVACWGLAGSWLRHGGASYFTRPVDVVDRVG